MKNAKVVILAVIGLLVVTPPVYPNSVKKLKIGSPKGFNKAPEIEVYSTNGEKYTTVDKTDQSKVTIIRSAKCKYEGKGNKAYKGVLSAPGYVPVGIGEPSHYLIPHGNEASQVFRFDNGAGQSINPVNVCNTELTKRVSQQPGKTKYHLMADGFKVNFPAMLKVKYTLTCYATGLGKSKISSRETMVNAKVNCKPSAKAKQKIPKPKPIPKKQKPKRATPLIKKISFVTDPKSYVGKCPVGIEFKGKISTNRAGVVSYQYIDNKGKKSPLFHLEFKKAGTKNTRKWHKTVSKPKTVANKLVAKSNKPKHFDVSGWYKLKILKPWSNKEVIAKYQVKCDAKAATNSLKNG